MIAKKYTVSGIVQGVGYRYFTINTANRLGMKGYAKNLRNGDVEVYAIGDEQAHYELLSRLKKGPSFSRVDNVKFEDSIIDKRYASFIVVY